jgi:hypothetical protein
MQSLKIDVQKFTGAKLFTAKDGTEHVAIPLEANAIFKGEKGSYLSLTLMDKPSEYGDGFATVDLGKQRREAGEKSAILGNWKTIGQAKRSPNQGGAKPPHQTTTEGCLDDDDDSSIPF